MKLYKIYQNVNNDYDTYDSAVVCADSEEDAKKICPDSFFEIGENNKWFFVYHDGTKKEQDTRLFSWCKYEDVQITYLGESSEDVEEGVVVSSFNAG